MSDYPGHRPALIGPLQSNKAKEAVRSSTAIHSVDRPSICEALAKEIDSQKRRPELFVQLNNRRGAAEGGDCAGRGGTASLPLAAKNMAADFRNDVHSAGERRAGAALRADRKDRRAQRAEESVDGA